MTPARDAALMDFSNYNLQRHHMYGKAKMSDGSLTDVQSSGIRAAKFY